MFGVLVNTVLVLVGSLLGSLLKRGLPEKLSNAIMIGVGLSVMYIGFSG